MMENKPLQSFNKQIAVAMRPEIEKALAEVAKKFGVEITVGKCTYGHTQMRYNLEILPGDKTQILAKEKGDFEYFAHMYHLEKTDFGREYEYKGEVYVICGLDLGRPKFVVKATRKKDGAEVFFPHRQVAMFFHPENAAKIYEREVR